MQFLLLTLLMILLINYFVYVFLLKATFILHLTNGNMGALQSCFSYRSILLYFPPQKAQTGTPRRTKGERQEISDT